MNKFNIFILKTILNLIISSLKLQKPFNLYCVTDAIQWHSYVHLTNRLSPLSLIKFIGISFYFRKYMTWGTLPFYAKCLPKQNFPLLEGVPASTSLTKTGEWFSMHVFVMSLSQNNKHRRILYISD